MALEEMRRDYTGTYDAAGEHAYGAAECCANGHSAAAHAGVFDAIAFETRAGSDEAFRVDAGVGAWC